MKKYSTLLGAAVVGLSAASSYAGITLGVTTVSINTVLSNAGWVGYKLTLNADVDSPAVASYDFQSGFSTVLNGNFGITGNIQQSWVNPIGGGAATPTITNAALPATIPATRDSFFLIDAGTGNAGGILTVNGTQSESNNLANYVYAGTPIFTASPLNDKAATSYGAGFNNGVGALMTLAGAYDTGALTKTTTLALIIVPGTLPTTIRGVAQDGVGGVFAIDTTLNAPAVPEPASLGLLTLGGLSLLARRRRA